jgi:ABC-type glycerol-3-phosphate transport system substrate-binding protein
MDDFNATNPNITMKSSMPPNDQWVGRLQTALNTESSPDLYMVPAQPQFNDDVNSNNLVDVTVEVALTPIVSVARDAVTVNEKVWAVPSGRYNVGICYHRDLFEQAGVTAEPTTRAEIRTIMDQLKVADITPYSIVAKDCSPSHFNYIGLASTMLATAGFDAVLAGTKKLNEPDMVQVVQGMLDRIPYYQENFLGRPCAESKEIFATRRTAMMDCGLADLSGYYEIDPEAQLG